MASLPVNQPGAVNDGAQYIVEPSDLWTQRLPARLATIGPRVIELDDGAHAWSFGDGAWIDPLGLEVAAGVRSATPLAARYRYPDLRPGTYTGKFRLQDMDDDGVEQASIFPTYGLNVLNLDDAELHRQCVRAYNDALIEWSADGDSRRLLPHALIPVTGLDDAIAELDRVIDLGYRGIVFGGWPSGGRIPAPADDRFWGRCEEAGVVVHLVRGGPANPERATRPKSPSSVGRYMGRAGRGDAGDVPMEALVTDLVTTKNANLSWLVLTGVLERFPGLLVVLVQAGAGWLETCGELLDWNYRYAQWVPGNGFARLKDLPSDSIRRQVLATVESDQRHLELASQADRGQMVLWSSAYPTSMSSWPRSKLAIDQWEELPGVAKADIVSNNYARTYRLSHGTGR
jgi:predicted TIM-barrel fold metal-dependent hydrolase